MKFEEKYNAEEDVVLISKALLGHKDSLEALIKKHQGYVYNIALNMASDPDLAADVTQEVLIKMLTSLSGFKNQSNFRTWLYRIAKNTFLNMRRGSYELEQFSFQDFADGLEKTADVNLADVSYSTDNDLLVEEAKLSCMKGMLLCFDRDQRFIYIIGELFSFPDTVGSEIMEISKENFRVKLHRARAQLYSFMDSKCGLINKNNPCRCARKTAGFIENGYVDPKGLHFQKDRIDTIEKVVKEKLDNFENELTNEYIQLFRDHPFLESPESLDSIKKLLSSAEIKKTFNLYE